MRVGGDFFFDPSPSDPTVSLLLVAGGVGINPLYSILLHATDLLHLNHASGGLDYNIGSVNLCYSAKNTQELLFKVCYIIFHCWNIFFCIFFFLLWSTTVSTCMSTSGSSVAICKQKLYYYLPSVFPELHHWGVSGVPWQVLLWLLRHATEHRCRPAPPAFSPPWVTPIHSHSYTHILSFV